jgi:geranylgeranyl diphosphate synthase type II
MPARNGPARCGESAFSMVREFELDLGAYLAERRQRVEATLVDYLAVSDAAPRIVRAMGHSLLDGGKRLRPILCMAAAEAVGGAADGVLPAACALEMIHTYSLIHDDLPAMDDDRLRRGRPTCHMAFDEATAILAGDALLTLAFEVLAAAGETAGSPSARIWLPVIRDIAEAAGYRGMVEGQMRDMAAETAPLSLSELEAVHRRKTGALIRVAVTTGARLAGASTEDRTSLERYADRLGLAFQVTDDILNVEGDPAVMGKAAGTDWERRKSTYPSLLGLAAAKTLAARLVRESLAALDGFPPAADPLRAIAGYVLRRRR